MDDKFCSLLEAACEASKHHEPQELENAYALRSSSSRILRSHTRTLSQHIKILEPMQQPHQEPDGRHRFRGAMVSGDGQMHVLSKESKKPSPSLTVPKTTKRSIAKMEFGVVKAEERVIKRGRITLQYLYDNLQKGQGTTLESAVRRDIGNTPDTSKALRMLVNARKIIRKGRGGRSDPFLYEIPSCVVEEIMATESEDDSHAQVYMSDGAAQEQKQEAPLTDQHASQRASDTAAAISGGAAMRPPLSPSSLIAEQQQPQPRQTCTISLDQGSFVSSLPINISALLRESRGPGRFTFSQALGACRKDYLGTSAGMLSCADRNAAEDQQMLHSSQDSMLSDGGTRSPKVWHFRPACPVHTFEAAASRNEAATSPRQQTQQVLGAQKTAPPAVTPQPAAAANSNAAELDHTCRPAVTQDTAKDKFQAYGEAAPGGHPSGQGLSTQRRQSFDKENSGIERSLLPFSMSADTEPGRACCAIAPMHGSNQDSGSFLRMGCNVKLALSPPRFKPFGMSS